MAHPFRFGVVCSNVRSGEEWTAKARRIEELGYASLLVVDRLPGPLAPLTALAMAAAATTSLHVGSYVFCNDYRHPALLAKEIATLDLLSNGRCEPGLGTGVGETDFQQLGLIFDRPGIRVNRLEEALHIIKPLLSGETVNFAGEYYTVSDLKGVPLPVQRPHPPILIGSAGKRMLSIAAREADIIAVGSRMDAQDVPLEEKIAWVREAAAERFERLEFAQTAYYLTLTDSPASVTPWVGPPIPRAPMSTEQAIEHLLERRERYGFSYIQVVDGQMENFAPVVAGLTGK